MPSNALKPELFRRIDESADADFYAVPRLVTHVDDATIAALTDYYRERLPSGGIILDLMSSWVSHLPSNVPFARVAGLGMNQVELQHNPRLDDRVVQDLNLRPELPYPDSTFDAVINAVSIQYLTRPIEVYTSVCRVLKPGGLALIATSHRCFPTKAIMAWHTLSPADRIQLIGTYLQQGGFDAIDFIDRSPRNADPMWIVTGRKP